MNCDVWVAVHVVGILNCPLSGGGGGGFINERFCLGDFCSDTN